MTAAPRPVVLAIAPWRWSAGCDQGRHDPGAAQQKGAQPPTVTVSKPLQREIIEWDEYTGRFEAVETVEIRARVSGYLTELHFKDGQAVKQGDLLFVLDARPFERTLEQAQSRAVRPRPRCRTPTSTSCAASRWWSGGSSPRRPSTTA